MRIEVDSDGFLEFFRLFSQQLLEEGLISPTGLAVGQQIMAKVQLSLGSKPRGETLYPEKTGGNKVVRSLAQKQATREQKNNLGTFMANFDGQGDHMIYLNSSLISQVAKKRVTAKLLKRGQLAAGKEVPIESPLIASEFDRVCQATLAHELVHYFDYISGKRLMTTRDTLGKFLPYISGLALGGPVLIEAEILRRMIGESIGSTAAFEALTVSTECVGALAVGVLGLLAGIIGRDYLYLTHPAEKRARFIGNYFAKKENLTPVFWLSPS